MVPSIPNVGNSWWAEHSMGNHQQGNQHWAPQAVAHGEDQSSPAGGELTDTACQIKNADPQIAGDVS